MGGKDGRSQSSARYPWIVAHRGDHGALPENTIPAFDAALRAGVQGIEFDVRLSADGIPVVWHDRTLCRIGGGRRRAEDLSAAAFSRLDVSALAARPRGVVRPPTLRQVLERYGGRTQLFIEIKSRPRDRPAHRHVLLARRVSREILQAGMKRKDFFILSFDREALREALRLHPSWRSVLNVENLASLPGTRDLKNMALSGCCLPVRRLTPRAGRRIRSQGLSVMTYACNMPYQVRRAVLAGADVIMSDRPAAARRFLEGSEVR